MFTKLYEIKFNQKSKIADCGVTQNSVPNTLVEENLLQVENCLSYYLSEVPPMDSHLRFIIRKRVRKNYKTTHAYNFFSTIGLVLNKIDFWVDAPIKRCRYFQPQNS